MPSTPSAGNHCIICYSMEVMNIIGEMSSARGNTSFDCILQGTEAIESAQCKLVGHVSQLVRQMGQHNTDTHTEAYNRVVSC